MLTQDDIDRLERVRTNLSKALEIYTEIDAVKTVEKLMRSIENINRVLHIAETQDQ
jgi:hypothetical protein